MAAKKKQPTRTVDDKLRGLVNLKLAGEHLYTQKEWAEKLGVSERTIRRYKNQKGYKLSERTIERVKAEINREDKKVTRLLDSGFAVRMKTTTVKGKRRRTPEIVRGVKVPKTRVKQIPTVYPSKSGESQTIKFDVDGQTTEQKIELLESAHQGKEYSAWFARVMVPPGVGVSGRKGEGEPAPEELDEDDEDAEPKTPPVFYMIGPFSMLGNRPKMKTELKYHEDAGRVIMEISLVEKIK